MSILENIKNIITTGLNIEIGKNTQFKHGLEQVIGNRRGGKAQIKDVIKIMEQASQRKPK